MSKSSSKAFPAMSHLSLLACWLLVAAGIAARFFGLKKGLTFDELYSMGSSVPSFQLSFIWHDILLKDINAPLYNILLYFWNHLFPTRPEWALRLPSLLCALLLLWSAWKCFPKPLPPLARRIYFFLLACNAYVIYYSQEARTYALVMLLAQGVLFSACYFARQMERKESIQAWKWTLFLGTGLISCYLHYFGAAFFFSVCTALAGYAYYYKRYFKTMILGTFLVFLAFCPWLWFSAQNGLEQAVQRWWIPYQWSVWARSTAGMFFNKPLLAYAMVGLAVIAVYLQVKTEGKKSLLRPEILIPLASIFIILAFVWVSSAKVNLLLPRYFLVWVSPIFLLLAQWWSLLIRRDSWLVMLLPVLLLGLMHPSFFDNIFSHKRGLNPMKSSVIFISRELEDPQLTYYLSDIDYPAPAREKILEYYPQRLGIHAPLVPLSQPFLDQYFKNKEAIRVWVPLCGPKRLSALEKDFDVYTIEPDYRHCFITLMPKSRFDTSFPAPKKVILP